MGRNFFTVKVVFIFLLSSFLGFENAHALTLTATEDISVSAIVGGPSAPGGGGGSSGSITIPQTAVRFSGQAYPYASVYLLKDGQEKAKVSANDKGDFSITLEEIYNDNILYSLFAEDITGNRSFLINYPIVVQTGYLTHLSGIRFAPTITTDKQEVKVSDFLTVNGYALPDKEIEIIIDGTIKKNFLLTSSSDGSYIIVLPISGLPKGDYLVSARYMNDYRFSKLVKVTIGELNILHTDKLANIPGDCNADGIINLVDFSVLAFWYGKARPPSCVDTNGDQKIDLTDFSILAFYWTG